MVGMSMRDFDVIVVGGGGAGLAAAVSAAEQGASVLVADAGDRLGGATALSTGVLYAGGTSVQRAIGIEDSAEAAYDYCMTLSQYRAQPSIIRRLCVDAASAVEWLQALGVEYRPQDLYVAGVDKVPRGHIPVDNGAAVVAALDQAAMTLNATVVLRTRVRRLLVESGRVCGIVVEGNKVRSGAVILASGGFGNNRHFLARYFPKAALHGDLTWYIGPSHSRGDGIAMGLEVNAAIAGHDCGLLQLNAGFVREQDAYLPGWLLFVNREGRRFVDETAAYAVMPSIVGDQPGAEAIVVFDEAARRSAKAVTTYRRLFENWTSDRLEHFAREGKLSVGSTLSELAERIGIREDTFARTVSRYNQDCDNGLDGLYFKPASYLKPVRTPPFYAARVRPATLVTTAAGLRIDDRAKVLDEGGEPIPGLYAAGETTGGVLDLYFAGGISIANCMVFGRVAGKEAAAFAKH